MKVAAIGGHIATAITATAGIVVARCTGGSERLQNPPGGRHLPQRGSPSLVERLLLTDLNQTGQCLSGIGGGVGIQSRQLQIQIFCTDKQ